MGTRRFGMTVALVSAVLMMGCADGNVDSGPLTLPKAASQAAQQVRQLQAKGEVITAEKAQQIMAPVDKASQEAVERLQDWQMRGGPADEGKEIARPFIEAKTDLEYLVRTLYNVDPAQLASQFQSYVQDPNGNPVASGPQDYWKVACYAFVGISVGACALIPPCWAALAAFCAANPALCGAGAVITAGLCAALPEWY